MYTLQQGIKTRSIFATVQFNHQRTETSGLLFFNVSNTLCPLNANRKEILKGCTLDDQINLSIIHDISLIHALALKISEYILPNFSTLR